MPPRGRSTAAERSPLPQSAGKNVNKKILVVDDDPIVLLVLRDALALCNGFEVHTAEDAQKALTLLRATRYDLVITDLSLPGLSGVQLTQEIRRTQGDMPVVWVTAYGCHTVERDRGALDVCCCLDKPVEIQEIRDTARRALGLDGTGQ